MAHGYASAWSLVRTSVDLAPAARSSVLSNSSSFTKPMGWERRCGFPGPTEDIAFALGSYRDSSFTDHNGEDTGSAVLR